MSSQALLESLAQPLRRFLRRQPVWVQLAWLRREGLLNAWRRRRIQRLILDTPPIRTARDGRVEVRILTWQRDWINAMWALKSFYHFACVDYPLYIHDGGLTEEQVERLRAHFPDAGVILRPQADAQMIADLAGRGLQNCLGYRSKHPFALKLLDFFHLSCAEYVISIDSDILFFRRPAELLIRNGENPPNRYNRDPGYWYSASADKLESQFRVRPAPSINAGLSLIRKGTIHFDAIEKWLSDGDAFTDLWLAEQTLHAMCAALHSYELLPDTYLVSTELGPLTGLISKHYPGFFRPYLYQEGMKYLVRTGFLGTKLQTSVIASGCSLGDKRGIVSRSLRRSRGGS